MCAVTTRLHSINQEGQQQEEKYASAQGLSRQSYFFRRFKLEMGNYSTCCRYAEHKIKEVE
eukprot:9210685-Prorocentrum_lima.AAC.1